MAEMGEVAGAGLLAHVPTIMLPRAERLELILGKDPFGRERQFLRLPTHGFFGCFFVAGGFDVCSFGGVESMRRSTSSFSFVGTASRAIASRSSSISFRPMNSCRARRMS